MRAPAILVALAASMVLAACGGASVHSASAAIERLRDRAKDDPNDPTRAAELGLGELFMAGGDASRAGAALERAKKLDPNNAYVILAQGVERDVHGEADAALASFVRAVDTASREGAAQGNAVVEVALASIERLLDVAPSGTAAAARTLEQVRATRSGNLGASARHMLASLLMGEQAKAGDPAALTRLASEAGCVATWKIVGPFGPRVLLGFDEKFGPEEDGLTKDKYDLGAPRGMAPVVEREARDCSVHLGESTGGEGGTFYALGYVNAKTAGNYDIRLETPNAVRLFVDGRQVASFDARKAPYPRVNYGRVELNAGAHRLLVKVTTRHPNPVLVVAVTPATTDPQSDIANMAVPFDAATHGYVSAVRRTSRGDVVGAREALRPLARGEDASPVMLLLAADVAASDPALGEEARRDEVRRLVTQAAKRDSNAWYSSMALARLDAADQRPIPAIDRLERATKRWPRRLELLLGLSGLYVSRDLDSQADAVIARARAVAPHSCHPLLAARSRAVERREYKAVDALSSELVRCDARQRAKFDVFMRQRRWDDALKEIKRLRTVSAESTPAPSLYDELSVARGQGSDKSIDRILETLHKEEPDVSDHAIGEADRFLALDKKGDAKTILDETAHEDGNPSADALRIRDAVFRDHPLRRYRLDANQVIRDFTASKRTYDQPKVLVLDYTVIRVFEDGSSAELTHNVWRAQTEEGINDLGEFEVPDGAELYTLRTHKADGRILEPDQIAGKDTISLPNLAPGDFVESEYVRYLPPNRGFPNGFQTWRFYFQSMEEAFDRSEFTVIVPKGRDVLIDPRGAAPKTEKSTEGDTQVFHWVVHANKPLVPEPMSVPPKEYIPSIQVSYRATWAAYVESLRDAFADMDVADPHALRIALDAAGSDADSAMERARRLYDWVVDHVEQEDDVFGSAAVMLNERSGNRARVYHYMLGLVGIPTDLVIAKTLGSDPVDHDVADSSEYSQLLVRVGRGKDARIVAVSDRNAPFGFLPPVIRGQAALVIDEAASKTRVPSTSVPGDVRRLDVDVSLERSGAAVVTVEETHEGSSAVSWRGDLEQIPAALLEQRFEEGYVARLVAGAELVDLDIANRGERDRPLKMTYKFRVRELGRRDGDRWVLPPLFPTLLAPIYAGVGSRTRTALIPIGQDLDVTLRIVPPEGVSLPEAPAATSLTSVGGSRVDYDARREKTALVMHRKVHVPVMRIPASDYAKFAEFCRESDRLEAREIAFHW